VADQWSQQRLPSESAVVGGGIMSLDLDHNAEDHNAEFPDEWATSVWAAAGLDAEHIAASVSLR